MRDVALTVSLSHYTATVHYTDCGYYTGYLTHVNQVVPPSVKMKTCRNCKPTAEDIVLVAGEVTWLEKYADAMSKTTSGKYDLEIMEKYSARDSLHGGRTLARSKND